MATVMMPSGTIAASGMTTRGLGSDPGDALYFLLCARGRGGHPGDVPGFPSSPGAWSNMILRTLNKRGPAHSGNRRRQAT